MTQVANETASARISGRAEAPLWRELAVLAGVCGFLFFFGLARFGLVGADEPRYAQIAREMLARHDWVTPVLYGKVWLEKPILYYWQAMLSYSIFGVSDWAARLPVAIDASAMVFAVYFFVRRFRPGLQLDVALVTASMAGVIGFGRAASMDMPLTATFTIGMLSWLAWHETGEAKWLAGFYVFLGLGMLAKGPVAPFLAAAVIVIFAGFRRDWRLVPRTLWIPGVLLFVAVALPWYVAVQVRVPEFFRVFVLEHNLARYGSNRYQHHQPWWYFAPVLILGLLPWTALAFTGLVRALRGEAGAGKSSAGFSRVITFDDELKRDRAIAVFLAVWAIFPVVFFSLSGSKLPGYIVPALPAWALLIGEWLYRKAQSGERMSPVLTVAHAAVATLPLGAALLSAYIVYHLRPTREAIIVAVVASGFVFAVTIAILFMRGHGMLRFATLIPLVLGLAFVVRVGAPAVDAVESARPVANEIRRLGRGDAEIVGLNLRRETEYGLAFYLNRPIAVHTVPDSNSDHVLYKGHNDHLLIVGPGTKMAIAPGVRAYWIGGYAQQKLSFYWVSFENAAAVAGAVTPEIR